VVDDAPRNGARTGSHEGTVPIRARGEQLSAIGELDRIGASDTRHTRHKHRENAARISNRQQNHASIVLDHQKK
jgi:hypothetical protein